MCLINSIELTSFTKLFISELLGVRLMAQVLLFEIPRVRHRITAVKTGLAKWRLTSAVAS